MGVKVVDRSGKLRTNGDRPSLCILIKLQGGLAVKAPKKAIGMRFPQIKAVKERIAPQQIPYIEALASPNPDPSKSKQTAVAFLCPRFAPLVIAVAFPKTEFFGFCKLQPVNPFSAFPGVQVRNY